STTRKTLPNQHLRRNPTKTALSSVVTDLWLRLFLCVRPSRKEMSMQLGMVGLGRMGANMVRRLVARGHECVVYDHSQQAVAELAKVKGVTGASSPEDFVSKLTPPRPIW